MCFSGLAFLAFLVALGGHLSARAQTPSPEYKLKAVFLFNFVQFVDWPTNAFADEHSPIVIGILGDDPFGRILDETVEGEIVRGRKLEVRRYRHVRDVENCQVIFIGPSEKSKLNSILKVLQGRSILTVGDMNDFADRGGMVRFIIEKNKIHFRINLEAAKAARLMISAKLLQLAEIASPSNARK